ncbi:MAG: type IV secretion system protein [Gemmatimonadota bacterium]|nr:type IV secretion system protein [Gemmatimonadota bacterium]
MSLKPFTGRRLASHLAADNRAGLPAATRGTVNHIIAARNEFANAFGDLAKGKRNWQLMAFALAGILGVVTLAYVRLASSSRVVPYVVEVNKLGQVMAVGPADRMATPDQRLVASQLAQFIRAIRTVLPAAAAAGQAEMIRHGYAFVAPEAAGFLNDYFANPRNDPRVLGTRLTRQVDVTGVLRVPNSDVWRLQWREVERSTQPGGPTRATAWEGYATVKLVPPASPEAIQDNPLGLYVTTINWTQVGETSSDRLDAPIDSSLSQTPLNSGAPR